MFSYKDIIYVILIAETTLFGLQMLTYKNVSSKSTRLLGVLMLFLSTYFFDIFFYNKGQYEIAIYGQYIVMPLFLSINPFYYLYIKTLTVKNYKFNKKSLINFIPAFLILLLNLTIYSALSYDEKLILVSKGLKGVEADNVLLKINIFIDLFAILIYYIQLIVYIILMIILLKKHESNIKNYFSYKQNISLNWLKAFIVIITLNALLEIFIVFTSFSSLFAYLEYLYYGFIFLLINFLGYFGIKQNDIYFGNIIKLNSFINTNENKSNISTEEIEYINRESKISVLSEVEQIKLTNDLKKLIENKKLYLNPELSIYDIANELNTNISYVSLSINNILQKNFRQFINEYRVLEAKQLLLDKKFNNLSIEGIAKTSGFTSMSSFRSSFQKLIGKTPSDFRNLNK